MKDWKEAPPIIGHVYWLYQFTAPKVWTGKYYECLVTDQVILKGKIRTRTEIHVKDWPHDIYEIERFQELINHH